MDRPSWTLTRLIAPLVAAVVSATVPGAVAGWVALHERFARLPFADLLAPAIEIAERGYAVPVVVQQKWQLASQVQDLASQWVAAAVEAQPGERVRELVHLVELEARGDEALDRGVGVQPRDDQV